MARVKKEKKKRKFDYYDAFESQAAIAVKEAKLLKEVVHDFKKASDLEQYLERAHNLEREGDAVCYSVFEALLPDFVTPIDREDIINLAQSLDEVTDMIEEIVQHFYMYDIHFMHAEAKPFAKLIVQATEALSEAMVDFRNCKKSTKFQSYIAQVNDLEDQADQLYMRIIRDLFTLERDNPVRVTVWSNLFDLMEDCADQCEAVANMMSTIMVKYA